MNKKRAFLVILLACILALITGLFLTKNIFTTKSTRVQQQQEETIPNNENKTIEVDVAESIENEKNEQNTKKEQVVEKTNAEKKLPTVSPLQIEPAKPFDEQKIDNNTNKKIEDTAESAGIIKDDTTNEIVITREYKIQSPARYSFEGYGVQKAPIK